MTSLYKLSIWSTSSHCFEEENVSTYTWESENKTIDIECEDLWRKIEVSCDPVRGQRQDTMRHLQIKFWKKQEKWIFFLIYQMGKNEEEFGEYSHKYLVVGFVSRRKREWSTEYCQNEFRQLGGTFLWSQESGMTCRLRTPWYPRCLDHWARQTRWWLRSKAKGKFDKDRSSGKFRTSGATVHSRHVD